MMGKLEKELEDIIKFVGDGGGFGDPDAERAHERQIEHLKFKITRRDTIKVAILSAVIGSVSAAAITLFFKYIGF